MLGQLQHLLPKLLTDWLALVTGSNENVTAAYINLYQVLSLLQDILLPEEEPPCLSDHFWCPSSMWCQWMSNTQNLTLFLVQGVIIILPEKNKSNRHIPNMKRLTQAAFPKSHTKFMTEPKTEHRSEILSHFKNAKAKRFLIGLLVVFHGRFPLLLSWALILDCIWHNI